MSVIVSIAISLPIGAFVAPAQSANAAITLVNKIPMIDPNVSAVVSAGLVGDTLRFVAVGFSGIVTVQFTSASGQVSATASKVSGPADTYEVVVPTGAVTGLVTMSDTNGHSITSATPFQVWKSRSEPYVMPTGHLNITYNDLQYILDQIKMAEAHSDRTATSLSSLSVGTARSTIIFPYDVTHTDRCLTADDITTAATSAYGPTGLSGSYLWTADDPLGLRTVNGECNNISSVMAESSGTATPKTGDTAAWGSAEQQFTRISPQANTSSTPLTLSDVQKKYQNPTAPVTDATPRQISNLISDQSLNNPAAIAAAYEASSILYGQSGYATEIAINATTGDTSTILSIPNITPDYNVSAGYDSWFTLFGQFFDHGLDLVPKAGPAVVIPLNADDPLYSSSPNAPNMMVLTRASDSSGQSTNETTPWIDQSQTYGSHASQNFFLREYVTSVSGGKLTAKTNGRLLENNAGGLPTWADIKAQALRLGIKLTDYDAKSVPVIATDQYGKFIPGANGYPIMLFSNGSSYEWIEGIATGLPTEGVGVPSGFKAVGSGHAFINDTTASAVPYQSSFCPNYVAGTKLSPDPDHIINSATAMPSCTYYDEETLDIHLVAGDGRVNENIGLSAVHNVFHSEHNLLVKDIQDMLAKDPIIPAAFKNEFTNATNGGERLYQAARFIMEMEYQHMAYDEFVRRIAPELPLFVTYDSSKNAAVTAEFASAVYRLGHSMLNETIARSNPGTFYDPAQNQDVALITAFTNPSQVRLVRPGVVASASFAGGIITYQMSANEVAPLAGEIVSISNMVNKGYNIQDAVVASRTSTTFTVSQNYKSGQATASSIVTPSASSTLSKTSDCDNSVPAKCTNYATAAISDPGKNPYSYTPDQATASIAQGMSSQRGNEIDEFVTDAVRNNLLGLPLDLATLNITRGRDVGLPTLNQFRSVSSTTLQPYLSWGQFIETGLRHVESGANFIAAYGLHTSITSETTTAGKRAAAIAITTAAQTVNITDAVSNGTSITFTGLNTFSAGQVISISGISGTAATCNLSNLTVLSADVSSFTVASTTLCPGYKQATAQSPGSGGYADFVNNGTSLAVAPPTDALDFYNSTGQWSASNSGLNDIDLWMGGLAEKPAKQPILAPMLGTTFQYVFTEQMQRLQDNDRFYYLSRLVGMNLFGEIPAQKFTDIVRRNTPSSSVGNSVTATGIIGMNNPGFGIADCAGSTTPGLVPGTMTCGGGKTDAVNLSLSHKGLDNVTLFADPLTLSHTTLIGGDGDDSIQGGAGNDSLSGGLGGDLIDGGAGNDVISGGPGEDILKGGAGDDVINTGTSQIGDIADGGSGSDFIHCGLCSGVATSFIGESGNDFIQGGRSSDLKLDGGEGDDWIEGGPGNDIIDGDNGPLLNLLIAMPVFFGGNDVITGGPGQDAMSGDGGDDIFNLGDGPGAPDGMFGFDWGSYEYNHRFDNSTALRPNVWADLSGGLTNPNLAHNNDQLANIEGLSGSSGNDVLYGGAGVADITIPRSNTPLASIGAISLTIPGAVNIAAGSVVTGTGIAPHTVILSAAPVVVGNAIRYQISAPTTASVNGPLQIMAAPLEVPSLITGLTELIAGSPSQTRYAASVSGTKWSGGAIILGGDGNDIIHPSSGSDVLHGSAYLHTCIGITKSPVPAQVTAASDVNCGSGRGFSNMTPLAPLMDAGVLNPGDLQIVREILSTSARVTGLVSDGVTATYTAANNFFEGEEISIVGLASTSAGNLSAYETRNAVITAVTSTSFTIASTVGAISQLNDITSGTAVGTDTLDLTGGSTLNLGGAGNVAGGGISGPSTQFRFTAITGTLPAGASLGCRMTDSVSGEVTTLYDFQRVVFTDGVVQYLASNCGTTSTPSTPAPPTVVPGPDTLSVTLSWTAPANNGAAIDYFLVEPSKVVNGRSTVLTNFTGSCAGQIAANLTSCAVTGLTAGDSMTFKLSAHNSAGISQQSRASATVVVVALSGKTVPTLSAFTIPNKTVGDPIFRIVAPTVGSAVPGAFTFSSSAPNILQITNGDSATALAAGTSRVTALFTPTDLTRFDTATVTATVNVSALSNRNSGPAQVSLSTITIPAKTVGSGTFVLTPPTVTPSVPGQFTFTSSNPAILRITNTDSATALAAGTATVTVLFTPADLTAFDTATATFVVTVNADSNRAGAGNAPSAGGNTAPVGGNSFQIQLTPAGLSNFPAGSVVNLAASGGNNSRIIFSTSTPNCRIIGTDLTATSATTCHVVATAGATTSSVDVPFTLATQTPLRISNKITSVKKSATIILTTIGGTSSGAVTYTLVNPGSACVLNTDELTATGPTTCQVKATKAGTSMYALIESPNITFTFN